jgi:thioredoxin-like negative regulator of GroEL
MTATRRFLIRALAVCLPFLLHPSSLILAEEVDWRPDYPAARREAVEKDRPLLLDFGYQGCVWCEKLEAVTFRADPVAQVLNKQFVPVKIDVHKDPDLAEKLRLQAYPTVVLAAPDGKILDRIEGFKEPEVLQERLRLALTQVAGTEWMARDYEEAGKAIGASDYARAITLLKNVVQDGKDRPVQVKARQLLQDIEQQSVGRLTRARQLADKGQTTEAVETVTEMIRVFSGTQAALEGVRMLTALATRPEGKEGPRTRRAREILAQAREDYRTRQYVWCLNRCDVLAAGYADLPEAAEAKQLADEIRDNPEWLRQACDGLTEQLGALYLSLAEAWLRKGQPQQAILCLERVIQTLPGTRQSEAAQVRLAQIQGQPATRTVEFQKP